MARIVLTEPADSDLAAIVPYLAGEAGAVTAEKYVGKFDALYAQLAVFPGSGAPRPLLGPAERIGLVPPSSMSTNPATTPSRSCGWCTVAARLHAICWAGDLRLLSPPHASRALVSAAQAAKRPSAMAARMAAISS